MDSSHPRCCFAEASTRLSGAKVMSHCWLSSHLSLETHEDYAENRLGRDLAQELHEPIWSPTIERCRENEVLENAMAPCQLESFAVACQLCWSPDL
jgi:hypothetical protein